MVSVMLESERFMTEIPRPKCPDKASIRLVLPHPGGPCSKIPLLKTSSFTVSKYLWTNIVLSECWIFLVLGKKLNSQLFLLIRTRTLLSRRIPKIFLWKERKTPPKYYYRTYDCRKIDEYDLCGIPRCLYQLPEDRNLRQSSARRSTTPSCRTTLSRGRAIWGLLSSRHSLPVHV